MTQTFKHLSIQAFIILFLALIFTGCVKHEEIEFRGKIIGIRECTASYLDQNVGYVVQLEYPEGVGGSITDGNNTGENLVVLYEPDRHIMIDDIISGTFYLDEKYSRANCSIRWDYELPEGVFMKLRKESVD